MITMPTKACSDLCMSSKSTVPTKAKVANGQESWDNCINTSTSIQQRKTCSWRVAITLKFSVSSAPNFLNAQASKSIRVTSVPRDHSVVNFVRTFIHIMKMSPITTGPCAATTQCYAPINVVSLSNVIVLGVMLQENAL